MKIVSRILKNKKAKEEGLSMVELGLVFTVIAVAIAATLYAYSSVKTSYAIQEANQQIQTIATSELAYIQEMGGSKYAQTNLSQLNKDGYIDTDYSTAATPFGGTYSVVAPSSGSTHIFDVTVDTQSASLCTRMSNEWNNASSLTTSSCSSGGNGNSLLDIKYNAG